MMSRMTRARQHNKGACPVGYARGFPLDSPLSGFGWYLMGFWHQHCTESNVRLT
jgi:hypothetical protein